ncbi:MAG: hypothetical protein ABII25_04135 [bacterium]
MRRVHSEFIPYIIASTNEKRRYKIVGILTMALQANTHDAPEFFTFARKYNKKI